MRNEVLAPLWKEYSSHGTIRADLYLDASFINNLSISTLDNVSDISRAKAWILHTRATVNDKRRDWKKTISTSREAISNVKGRSITRCLLESTGKTILMHLSAA
eukprot:Pompholyxophrys_punicea_v1_NODE_1640_length_609_cov_25.824910.p2 type:complete len:104 gc:universal NODE_1640_length_609_cov_25.824910:557-246(-)